MKSIEIYNELKDKEQFAIECTASLNGIKIPQVKIEIQDVERAISENPDVSDNFINEYGFLTSVYISASHRLCVDTSEFDNDLFVEFS